MGPYLSVPKKEKHPTFGENAKVSLFLPKLSLLILKNVDQVWSMWNARLEEHNGRLIYSWTGYWPR